MLDTITEVLSLLCVLIAAALSLTAGVGLLRFPDALSRLHAATKPQIFGLLMIIASIALHQQSWMTLFALIPAFVFQSLTAPIAGHMVGRAAYRTGELDTATLSIDELAPAIERANADRNGTV